MSTDDGPNGLGIFLVLIIGSVALVVFTVTLLLGMTLVGGMAADMGETIEPYNTTASPNPEPGTAIQFANTAGKREVIEVYQVNDSTGYAVNLTGADDSYVQSKESVNLAADDTWSVSTWARVDSDAQTQTMTAVSANGRVLIQYNGSAGNWSAWYYEEGDRDSWRVNVTANQPGNLSLVTATSNGTHFWIYRNATKGQVVNITGSNIANATLNATNWHGTLEETRVFDDETNDSEQSALYNNPVAPRDERNRTARIMYDEGKGSTTAIYFTGTQADLSNFTWTKSGLPGHELTEGADYELRKADGTITAIVGGSIDDAPVVWIDYRYQALSNLGELNEALQVAFGLISRAAIAIPAIAVLIVLIGGLFGAIKLANFEFDIPGKKGNR